MKRFYALLALVAVVAVVLIWKSTQTGSGAAVTPADAPPVPMSAADSAFPGHILGSDSAPVEIVEYADFQCPHCGQFAVVQFPTIRQQLINTGLVRWRFRPFPLGWAWSRPSALAAECAGEQHKYWEMADALFGHQADWVNGTKNPSGLFREYARSIGLDVNAYDACMESQRYAGRIEASHEAGLAQRVTGTPTFFANGVELNSTRYANSDAFKALADSLAKGRR
jgi:protein-disulfide isomerase